MKIWCLLRDQQACAIPVEAACRDEALFVYDAAWEPEPMVAERPDLVLCVNDYPWDVVRCLDMARAHRIPSLALQDGILEWRCQYENPLFGAGGGAPQHQPVIADKIACIGRQSARQIASWNDASKVEVTGMPRLDYMFSGQFPAPQRPGKTILVMTAKNPGFTPEQREVTVKSVLDVKRYLQSRTDLKVVWRVSKAVASELGVENQLQQVSSPELASILNQVDGVVTTLSTAMVEAMVAGRPVAALDYHNVPRFVPTAWTISAPGHIESVVNELMNPPATKMAFQQDCLADSIYCGGDAAERVAGLIRKMVALSKACEGSKALRFPAGLVSDDVGTNGSTRPSLASLYQGQSVFQENNVEQLQVRLARAENENCRLKTENCELRRKVEFGSWIKEGVRRLRRFG